MGIYINPGSEGFAEKRRGRYQDKSGLIRLVNRVIDTPDKLICISRPRRFGKTTAAQMLSAYYVNGADNSALFDDLEIASDPSYQDHRNKYNVILLDITGFISRDGINNIVPAISNRLCKEIAELYPDMKKEDSIDEMLIRLVEHTGTKCIAIIDEWDAPIRDSRTTPDIQKDYLEFLRSLFKNANVTGEAFAAAYMTGILPIKKDGSHSAISEFQEYTMIEPRMYAPYIGFNEDEVKRLCEEEGLDFEQMQSWYDGYSFEGLGSVYNPNSVMKAVKNRSFESYWENTTAADTLLTYINMDYDGLGKAVTELLADQEVAISTGRFRNDLSSFKSRDDVLTLLIHLGYLCYDKSTGTVHIPNDEIRMEFAASVREISNTDTIRRVKESEKLIQDTVEMKADAVAAQIEKVHTEEIAPLHYNSEEALRSVIRLAYFAYRNEYIKAEELPAGKSYADIVFIPKKRASFSLPALLIELKWDKDAVTAIDQIKSRQYPEALKDFGADILLVGISYDKDEPEKKHSCIIERAAAG